MGILSLLVAAMISADPVVLENGVLRIEIDPEVFSLRYIGFSGGRNFVEPIPFDDMKSVKAWLDPGGLTTDVLPVAARDASIRRGPAEVLKQDALCLVMLGPVSAETQLQLKKEIRLDPENAAVWYNVSALTPSPEKRSCFVRNMGRIPQGSTLRVKKQDVNIRTLQGKTSLAPVVVKSMQFWLIPVPPTHRTENALLGAFVDTVEIQNREGLWRRRIHHMPPDPDHADQESTFVCVLDDKTRSYGVALQSGRQELSAQSPVLFSEEWTFERLGR